MAARDTSIRFDIVGRDLASDAFLRAGRSVSDMGNRMDASATKAAFLDDALKRQAETGRRTSDAMLALARSDAILDEAERRLRDGALEAEFALKKQGDGYTALGDKAKRSFEKITAAADRMKAQFPELKVKINDAEAKTKLKLFEAETKSSMDRINKELSGAGGGRGIFGRMGGLFGGGSSSGAGSSSGGGLLSALPAASGIVNPYTIGLGAAALPFIAQLASGAGIFALGGGLAGLGVAGALGTGATVTPAMLTAAQDRLKAAQLRVIAAQAAVAKKNTPAAQATLASSQASVITAQASLVKLQDNAQTPAQLQMRQAFHNLSNDAQNSLAQIGTSFVPVMASVFKTADSTLLKLTPVFAGAVKIISGPFQVFADTIIKSFAQPAVTKSIGAVASSFAILLKALTPQIPGMFASIANGITSMAKAVAANPQAFADFIDFLVHAVGWTFQALAALTRFASYIEKHWVPVFDGARHEIAHVWDQIFENSIGTVIRLGHDVERDFNDFRHRTAVIFDGVRHDIAHYWDMAWNNTVGRLNNGMNDVDRLLYGWEHNVAHWFDTARHDVAHIWDLTWNNTIDRVSRGIGDVTRWFAGLPGKVTGALAGLGGSLYSLGKTVIGDLWGGLKSVWGGVLNWAGGLWKDFLHALGPFHSPPKWASWAGEQIMHGLFGWLSPGGRHKLLTQVSTLGRQVGAAAAAAAAALGGGPSTAGNVVSWLRQAMADTGAPASWLPGLETIVAAESGGNPMAYNPSGASGLMQTMPGTYAQFATVGGGIWNPVSNAVAAIRYIMATYGSPYNIPNLGTSAYKGYAAGTMSAAPGWGWVGERGPELMHFRGGEQVLPATAAARGAGGDTYNVTVNVGPGVVNARQVGREIAHYLAEFKKGGGWVYKPGGF